MARLNSGCSGVRAIAVFHLIQSVGPNASYGRVRSKIPPEHNPDERVNCVRSRSVAPPGRVKLAAGKKLPWQRAGDPVDWHRQWFK
jgi:hypothetical protein